MRFRAPFGVAAFLATSLPAIAADPGGSQPLPVAASRPELKLQLEASKHANPRLPLPAPTEAEIAEAKARPGRSGLGGIINNGRMRKLYLPAEVTGGGFIREPDPAMTLSRAFTTEFFWIASRINNCAYCQGHQEVKLASDGVSEETIAALDGDWSEFKPAERAAFAFTKKLSATPQSVKDEDIAALRAFYTPLQVLEIISAVAGFNAMNRWTGPLAIPQEDHRTFLSETPRKYLKARSQVAPLDPSAGEGVQACALPANRGPLESRSATEAALDASRKRISRLPLVDESATRALLPADFPAGPVPNWVRLLANFPKAGPPRVAMHRAAEQKGHLDSRLRAEIAWTAARQDRAWYALGHARQRLRELGLSDDQMFAIDDPNSTEIPANHRQALEVARKITVNPALITDADIAGLRKPFSDHEVAEIVFQTTEAAYFDRLTEAAGLPLEKEVGEPK